MRYYCGYAYRNTTSSLCERCNHAVELMLVRRGLGVRRVRRLLLQWCIPLGFTLSIVSSLLALLG